MSYACNLLAILHQYFKRKLEELSILMDGGFQEKFHDKENMDLDGNCKSFSGLGKMDVDEHYNLKKLSTNSLLVKNIGKVVQDLRGLGFTSMTEDAYASAIFLLLKVSICHCIAEPVHAWIVTIYLLKGLKYWSNEIRNSNGMQLISRGSGL